MSLMTSHTRSAVLRAASDGAALVPAALDPIEQASDPLLERVVPRRPDPQGTDHG